MPIVCKKTYLHQKVVFSRCRGTPQRCAGRVVITSALPRPHALFTSLWPLPASGGEGVPGAYEPQLLFVIPLFEISAVLKN